jgi:REP element-mobilizing transposase RayT
MGRTLRTHQPGSFIHLTSRLHGREALFTPEVRTAIVSLLREQVAFGEHQLVAYAIMPNHLHVILRQGDPPLSRFMQPLLRRVALLIQRKYDRQGHVVERRYRSHPCRDASHIRNAIAYVHLNPVAVGLAKDPADWAWSSHRAWIGEPNAADGRADPAEVWKVMPLFATAPGRTQTELIADYQAHVTWRSAYKDWLNRLDAGTGNGACPQPPPVAQGDANGRLYLLWEGRFDGPAVPAAPAGDCIPFRPDLSAIAREVLADAEPGLEPGLVRSRWGGKPYTRTRHEIIRRASAVGYRNTQIAAYLRLSTTAVSAVLTAERKRLLLHLV